MKDDVDEDDAGALSSTSVPETTISYGDRTKRDWKRVVACSTGCPDETWLHMVEGFRDWERENDGNVAKVTFLYHPHAP